MNLKTDSTNPIASLPSPRASERPQQFVVRTKGREIIQAIDLDNASKLFDVLIDCDLNEVVAADFAGYTWNPWVYNYLGDTMLHIAVRMKKRIIVSLLYFLGADAATQNCSGESPGT